MEPLKDAGQNVYPAFEGWYQNSDGSYTLLLGYYNRNKKQTLDIPIGPENRIEPGGPDQGQPTHFVVGRGWGTISIKVPKDFGDKKITWTLTANGKTVTIPFGITKGYQIEPYKDEAMGNTPPKIKLAEAGPALTGPPGPLSTYPTLNGAVGEPVTLTYWITDDGNEETPTGAARRLHLRLLPARRPPRRRRPPAAGRRGACASAPRSAGTAAPARLRSPMPRRASRRTRPRRPRRSRCRASTSSVSKGTTPRAWAAAAFSAAGRPRTSR